MASSLCYANPDFRDLSTFGILILRLNRNFYRIPPNNYQVGNFKYVINYPFIKSMLIKEKIGNINFFALYNRKIDSLLLEWYETNKRILHKKTTAGVDVVMKFLNENQQLTEGDIIYEDDFSIVVIEVKECDAMIIKPKTMFEMASVCYEIGNKHIPVFYQQDEILVAYEAPLFKLLSSAGYDVSTGKRKLINPLKTSVSPHGHSGGSLFSKIMKLTNPPE